MIIFKSTKFKMTDNRQLFTLIGLFQLWLGFIKFNVMSQEGMNTEKF